MIALFLMSRLKLENTFEYEACELIAPFGLEQISLIVSNGKILNRKKKISPNEEVSFQTRNVSAGIYFLQFFIGDEMFVKKVFVR